MPRWEATWSTRSPLSDGSVFAYVADVSGHGLPAGILMGMIKTAVRTQLVDFPAPTAVFERLNEVFYPR